MTKYILLVCSGRAEELIAVNKRKNGEIHLTTEGKQDISHLQKNEESQRKYILLVCNGWAEELIAVNKRKNGEIHLTTEGKQDISHLQKKEE